MCWTSPATSLARTARRSLGDLGAEVIKIEAHRGDQTRDFPSTLKGEPRRFLGAIAISRGSCTTSSTRRRAARCRRPGFDQVLQAMTGIAVSQGGEGTPQVQAGSVVDYYTATLAAYGVVATLFVRECTGFGQKVETSLLHGALAMQSARFIWVDDERREAKRDLAGGINRIFKTKVGDIYISANTETFWQSLCQTIGLAELGTNRRHNYMAKRSRHVKHLVAIVETALQSKSPEDWEELLSAVGVPCTIVRPIEDMFDHPQVKALDMVAHVTHPVVGGMRMLNVPMEFSKISNRVQHAPTLGEHTETSLQSLSYTADQVAELKRANSQLTPFAHSSDTGNGHHLPLTVGALMTRTGAAAAAATALSTRCAETFPYFRAKQREFFLQQLRPAVGALHLGCAGSDQRLKVAVAY